MKLILVAVSLFLVSLLPRNAAADYIEYMARPRREQPYYFDIYDETSNRHSRLYFDLKR